MRILLLLVVVAIMGLSLSKWLGHPSPPPISPAETHSLSPAETHSRFTPPPAPTRPQAVQGFAKDLDRFMQDTAAQRTRLEPDQ